MPAADLDRVMGEFYDRRLDLLIATNIIESGLDIPTANTLIVHRADQFGLAQLYQLRGRVGRSKVRGYAYFTVPANKTLADTAERRLSRDPVAGGAGRGLPAGQPRPRHPRRRQPAGRRAVGPDPRGRLRALQPHARGGGGRAARAAAGAPVEAARGRLDAADHDRRRGPDARELSSATSTCGSPCTAGSPASTTPEELEAFAAELIDRFGKLPPETEQLLQLVAIKQLCRKANVAKLDAGPKGIVLAFRENRFARPERLVRLIAESRGQMKVRPDHKVVLLRETADPVERLQDGAGS